MSASPEGRRADPRDPVLHPDDVLRLVRRHVPEIKAVTAVDESGNQARAYVVDEQFIMKTQRPHKKALRDLSPEATWPVASYADLEKETFLLRELERQFPGLPIPRAIGYGREDAVEYIVMTRVNGASLREVELGPAERVRALRELGRVLRQIHSISVDPLRLSRLFPGDRQASDVPVRIERLMADALTAARAEAIDWGLGSSAEVIADEVADTLRHSDLPDPVALHSNPGPEHVFVDPESHVLTGLIDFGDSYFSHPVIDMRRWSSPADRQAVLEGYVADAALGDSFREQWRAIMTALAMHEAVFRPARREAALLALRSLVQ